jgi:Fe-S-cluster containining protein
MPQRDTPDKLIPKYFPAFVTRSFTFVDSNGNLLTIDPKPAKFSSQYLHQGYECVLNCGGCCPAFSLDWPEYEYNLLPDHVKNLCQKRYISIDNRQVLLYSIMQTEEPPSQIVHGKAFCQFLNLETLGCNIHQVNPLSCALPLLDFQPGGSNTSIIETPMGRGHMIRLPIIQTLTIGVKCKRVSQPDVVGDGKKIARLKKFIEYCGLPTTKGKLLDAS